MEASATRLAVLLAELSADWAVVLVVLLPASPVAWATAWARLARVISSVVLAMLSAVLLRVLADCWADFSVGWVDNHNAVENLEVDMEDLALIRHFPLFSSLLCFFHLYCLLVGI